MPFVSFAEEGDGAIEEVKKGCHVLLCQKQRIGFFHFPQLVHHEHGVFRTKWQYVFQSDVGRCHDEHPLFVEALWCWYRADYGGVPAASGEV